MSPLVRLNIVTELEGCGLYVVEAGNAIEAISVLGDNPSINVVFTDIDMPGGVDCLELARIVKERFPPIQVVVTSGHHMVPKAELPPTVVFIAKPYVSEEIIRTILQIADPK